MEELLIPALPQEIAMECLIRMHYTCHVSASRVCRRWRDLIASRDFYLQRNRMGTSRTLACLLQSLPPPSIDSPAFLKPVDPPRYGITVLDPLTREWDRLPPIPKHPDGLPIFCRLAGVEGKLLVMGGWDPSTWAPLRDLFVYDFKTRRWQQGQDMPGARSFFAVGAAEGRVYVAGGHDESKDALKSAWVYDVERDDWTEVGPMEEERDECEGVVSGAEFWVVSGYSTESQGRFKGSAEVYVAETGEWRLVEGAWASGKCPRACVGPVKDGKVVCWANENASGIVGLKERALITGSAHQDGGAQTFFLAEWRDGGNGDVARIDVPKDFTGFVQSGCCLEI